MILTVTANTAVDKRYVTAGSRVGEVNRVKTVTRTAGGKGLNVSRAAFIAGEEVLATGFLGGHNGRLIEELLAQDGISGDFVWCEGESRDCINIWDETTRTQTEFLEPGFEIGKEDMGRLAAKVEEKIDQADVITISGSVPRGADAGLYGQLLDIARAHGKKAILDTSGQLLADSIAFRPYMIKPNIDEIRMLTGMPMDNMDDILAAAKKLHEAGIACVVISLGASGAVMSCEDGAWQALVPKVDAVNTVGCGDSMIGGFAAAIARGMSMPEALRFAASVSTAAAMTTGTGSFRPEDQKRLIGQIRLKKPD